MSDLGHERADREYGPRSAENKPQRDEKEPDKSDCRQKGAGSKCELRRVKTSPAGIKGSPTGQIGVTKRHEGNLNPAGIKEVPQG